MKKLILIASLLFILNTSAQDEPCPDTPCGYCNCDEIEGDETDISNPFLAVLASVGACMVVYFVYKNKNQ